MYLLLKMFTVFYGYTETAKKESVVILNKYEQNNEQVFISRRYKLMPEMHLRKQGSIYTPWTIY